MAEGLVTQVSELDDENLSTRPPGLNFEQSTRPAVDTKAKPSPCWSLCCPCFGRTGKKSAPTKGAQAGNNFRDHSRNRRHLGGGGGSSTAEPESEEFEGYPSRPPTGLKRYLLPPLPPERKGRKCLVLDLDETLVHSSFKPIPNPDFEINIELENVVHRVYVRKRPGVDNFLREVGEKFEVVIFTASLAKYADPLLDILDPDHIVAARLFRESCVQHFGNYVKDLSHLGRRLESTIIIDNSPFSYMFQPDNAIPITSWFTDQNDRQLYDLLPFLDSIVPVEDVCTILQKKKLTFSNGSA